MHGEDSFSINEKIQTWKREFEKRYEGDINISELDGEKVKVDEIITSIDSMPFFSEKRLILVKNFLSEQPAEEQKKLVSRLTHVEDTSVLVFYELTSPDKRLSLYKYLTKTAKIYEFPSLRPAALNKWITERVISKNGKINTLAASYLAEQIGPNLWKLSSEIDKLISYTNGQEITSKDIDILTRASAETSIFKLTDQIGQRRTTEAIRTLNELIDGGEELMYIFAMIVRQVRILIEVKDMLRKSLNRQQIVDRLKANPFVVTNAMAQARNYEPETLKRIHGKLLELDTKMKTGKINFSTAQKNHYLLHIEKLIVEAGR
ncbi:MAG: DNA polymerase III subunit delta [Candidatus Gracilibacteria bacterium]|jgi:DNA polymerase-3 subunit delta